MGAFQRGMVMVVLCFSGGTIYMLPFLREVYYVPMQEAFGYTNTQMGVLISVFGAISLLTYFPGGWIADRFSPRKLMSSGLLLTGLAGVYFSTFPSYSTSIAIHGFWGASISLTFWGAMIKTTRNWAAADEQGKAFGILESGRGIAELGTSTLFLAVFAWLGSNTSALAQVINLFALTNIGLAIVTWFVLDDKHEVNQATASVGLQDVIAVLKMPAVWLISIVVLCAYSAYWGSYYFAPYATEAYSMSVVVGASIAVGKMWLKPVAALFAGVLADRVGVSKTVLGFFITLTACYALLGLLPGGKNYFVVMLVTAAAVSISIFALRAIYFALLDEGGIPSAVTGTAAGVVSAIGFTPDVFMPLLGGVLLDNYPGVEGYRYYYSVIAVLCVIGGIAAYLLLRKSKRVVVS